MDRPETPALPLMALGRSCRPGGAGSRGQNWGPALRRAGPPACRRHFLFALLLLSCGTLNHSVSVCLHAGPPCASVEMMAAPAGGENANNGQQEPAARTSTLLRGQPSVVTLPIHPLGHPPSSPFPEAPGAGAPHSGQSQEVAAVGWGSFL